MGAQRAGPNFSKRGYVDGSSPVGWSAECPITLCLAGWLRRQPNQQVLLLVAQSESLGLLTFADRRALEVIMVELGWTLF